MANFEERLLEKQQKGMEFVRSYMYVIIAVIGVLVIVFVQLGALDYHDVDNILDLIVNIIPLFMVTVILTISFWGNGVLRAKNTKKFCGVIEDYSTKAGGLTDKEVASLPDFCIEYNVKASDILRKNFLTVAGFTIEQFHNNYLDTNGKECKALKLMNSKELKEKFGKDRAKCVKKAKGVKVKGLRSTELLSETFTEDITYIGKTESSLTAKHFIFKFIMFLMVSILFAFIGYKDISMWGWGATGILMLKICVSLGGAWLSQLSGYEMVMTTLINRYIRKTDILKIFKAWYDNQSE